LCHSRGGGNPGEASNAWVSNMTQLTWIPGPWRCCSTAAHSLSAIEDLPEDDSKRVNPKMSEFSF